MKKNYYLFTLCAILFGFTMNAQIHIMTDDNATAWTFTQKAANFTNSLIIGSNTTQTLTTASGNTALGFSALDNLKQGANNTAVGFNAGTTVGGGNANDGQANSMFGKSAGEDVGTGSYNTMIGASAGSTVNGGDKNVFVGHNTGNAAPVASTNRIGLGQNAQVAANNTANIGNADITNVYFGGNAANTAYSATLNAKGLVLENDESITNATDGIIAVAATTTTFSGNVTVNSDMRLKDNIESLGNTISDILKLDGKSYTREGRDEIGLLAQDVELIYPELVSVDENGILSVNYQALTPVLINGVKDQEARIAKQEERIAKLEILVNLLLNGK